MTIILLIRLYGILGQDWGGRGRNFSCRRGRGNQIRTWKLRRMSPYPIIMYDSATPLCYISTFLCDLHNGERVSNKILVFFVIPYKIEINLSPYPWKNCSEASKHVNFQLQKFTISITLPKISIFLQHLHFHFFKNVI